MSDITKKYVDYAGLQEYDSQIKGVISTDFVGATSLTDGVAGRVPAPESGDENKYLRGDGTWSNVNVSGSVTGVKGDAESTYRDGNVNITPGNIGLGNVPNVTTNNQTPTYTESSSLTGLTSGETLSTAFGKIAKAITDLISHIGNTNNPHSVTKAQVGLGDVGNFKAVSTVASQGLSSAEQSNARDNISAASTTDVDKRLYKYNFIDQNKLVITCSTTTGGYVEVHVEDGILCFRTSRDIVELSYVGINPNLEPFWTYSISGTTITLNVSYTGGTSGFVVSADTDITVTVSDTSDPQTNGLRSTTSTDKLLAFISDVNYVVFKGTSSQWSVLDAAEKAKYKIVILTDD